MERESEEMRGRDIEENKEGEVGWMRVYKRRESIVVEEIIEMRGKWDKMRWEEIRSVEGGEVSK